MLTEHQRAQRTKATSPYGAGVPNAFPQQYVQAEQQEARILQQILAELKSIKEILQAR